MKILNKSSLVFVVLSALVVFGFTMPFTIKAATSPTLTGSTNYSVLGASTVTNTGITTIGGNLGVSPGTAITGFPPGIVGGTTHSHDADAISAQTDDVTAFGTLDQTCDHSYADGQDLTLLSPLSPGVYCSAGSFAISGNLTLSGSGVWIFKSVSTLITASHSVVTGGDPCNVWWRVGSSATLGTSSSIIGNIFALASITFNTSATLNGRALAQTGAVTLDTNTISAPVCGVIPSPTTATLNVVKHVVNDNGGTAKAGNWNLAVASSNGGTGIGNATGTESGTAYTLQAGSAYKVTESGGLSGYLESDSADCDIANAVAGKTYNCTITNDDIAPSLTLNKVIVGGTVLPTAWTLTAIGAGINPTSLSGAFPVISGATFKADTYTLSESGVFSGYTPSSWTCAGATVTGSSITLGLGDIAVCTITNTYTSPVVYSNEGGGSYTLPVPPLIDVVKVPSPLALPAGPGSVVYTYTLKNIGTVPVNNVTMVDDSCSPLTLVSGDINADKKLDTTETWTYSCSTILSKTHTNAVVATGWANGISATDIAYATVVVSAPVVPPLIHVTKIPNPLALLSGAGNVTYTEKITNPGTVALSNVTLSDDKCNSVKYISGDINKDSKLDTTETWTYTCQTRLSKTTTNTATATGVANGITVKDFAIATVVVSTPSLPKTGFPPRESQTPWNIILSASVLGFLVFFYFASKKQTN